jgi:hypothetical protein
MNSSFYAGHGIRHGLSQRFVLSPGWRSSAPANIISRRRRYSVAVRTEKVFNDRPENLFAVEQEPCFFDVSGNFKRLQPRAPTKRLRGQVTITVSGNNYA